MTELLRAMLDEFATDPPSTPRSLRPRLYVAYALTVASGAASGHLEARGISPETTRSAFADVGKRCRDWPISQVFRDLECTAEPRRTKAYWALTYAIGIYMWHMAHKVLNPTRGAHSELVGLINKLLLKGHRLDVVDFNYDCLLERVRFAFGSLAQFAWNTPAGRRIIADSDGMTLTSLAELGRFIPAPTEASASGRVGLVKPHGDWCTFLRGRHDVFHRGGRYSQTHSAALPPKLADIEENDHFVRSSIMPPTDSDFRHRSVYYQQEERHFLSALSTATDVCVVGWSASGPDSGYSRRPEIAAVRANVATGACNVWVIDRNPDFETFDPSMRRLFGERAFAPDLRNILVEGFTEPSVDWLCRQLIR